MFDSRPSQKKVVGVSHRFLAYEENSERMFEQWSKLDKDDISLGEVYGAFVLTGCFAVHQLVTFPGQASRRNFLQYAREVEGLAPGQESISAYALASSGTVEMYPRVRKSLN